MYIRRRPTEQMDREGGGEKGRGLLCARCSFFFLPLPSFPCAACGTKTASKHGRKEGRERSSSLSFLPPSPLAAQKEGGEGEEREARKGTTEGPFSPSFFPPFFSGTFARPEKRHPRSRDREREEGEVRKQRATVFSLLLEKLSREKEQNFFILL